MCARWVQVRGKAAIALCWRTADLVSGQGSNNWYLVVSTASCASSTQHRKATFRIDVSHFPSFSHDCQWIKPFFSSFSWLSRVISFFLPKTMGNTVALCGWPDLPRLHFNASISVAWEEEVVVSVGFPFVLYWGGSTSPLGTSSFFSDA